MDVSAVAHSGVAVGHLNGSEQALSLARGQAEHPRFRILRVVL